jgi:hypothetical protein
MKLVNLFSNSHYIHKKTNTMNEQMKQQEQTTQQVPPPNYLVWAILTTILCCCTFLDIEKHSGIPFLCAGAKLIF